MRNHDIAQPTISALEVIKTFNAKDDTMELKQIILQKNFIKNSTGLLSLMQQWRLLMKKERMQKLRNLKAVVFKI
jgi:hypothetical protein